MSTEPANDVSAPQAAALRDAQPPEPSESLQAPLPFHTVASGASAGGVEALIRFFSCMPPDSGCAFVVVMHLAHERESMLATLLGRATAMKVEQLRAETALQANHVYVAPPAHHVEVAQGRLRLREIHGRPVKPAAVDHLMASLASDQRERAIGVVLTGTDADGTIGVKAISSEGGFVIAQSPAQAAHPGMPLSAVSTGMVDRQLTIEEMPKAILDFVGVARLQGLQPESEERDSRAHQNLLSQILETLLAQLGLDFRGYKTAMLLRRVRRRMALSRITELGDYFAYLVKSPAEARALADDFLISVTEFFRDPETWDTLASDIVPQILARKEPGTPVRVWVPACASGEEAYTIAMLFLEHPRLADRSLRLQVFATDVAHNMLDLARRGRYPGTIEHSVSPDRLERHFVRVGHDYQVRKELREAVMFAPQNLIADPPFSHIDLVSCRNLLIYLIPDLQRRLLQTFHFSLEAEGFLVLGKSETAAIAASMYTQATHRARIYRRVGPPRPTTMKLPPLPGARPGHATHAGAPQASDYAATVRDALALRHSPAAVLINREGRALYFHGLVQGYLHQPPGAPISDLFAMVHEELRPLLRALLHKACTSRSSADAVASMKGGDSGSEQAVRMVVTPLPERGDDGLLLVAFERVERELPLHRDEEDAGAVLRVLEDELRNTKRELRAAIEELESTNEELKVANEEAMSMNEELQSANEELETSKEELQSINEELTTVNNQLQEKVNELEAVNDDLGNLLTSTHIPTLFLDRQLNIKRYTPAATRLFRLIPGDLNRPLSDIASQIDLPSLFADARRVLEQLTPVEQEMHTPGGEYYLRRVLPYRTQEDRIDGVVITFIDITDIRRAAEGQRRFAAVMQASSDAIVVHDIQGRVLAWNRGAEAMYGHAEAEVLNTDFALLLPTEAREQHGRCLQRLLAGERIVGVDTQRRRRDGALLDISASYTLVGDAGHAQAVALIERDVTSGKHAEHELRESEQRFRTLADSAPVLVWMSRSDGAIEFVNREFCHFTGMDARALAGRRWTDVLHGDDVDPVLKRIEAARRQVPPGRVAVTAQVRTAGGVHRWMKLSVIQRLDEHGAPMGLVGSMADIDAQVGAERELRAADRRKDEFLAMLGHELRNPLVPIRNAAEVLSRIAGDDNRLRWVRDTLVRQVEHVTRLVDDLLNISLITRGILRLQLEPVELSQAVERAIDVVMPLIQRKRHRLESRLSEEPLWVEGDAIRLTQVFENLLTNAAKYTNDAGELGLELVREGDHAVVHVRDNGLGLAPSMHRRVFDLFVQDERSIDRSQGGLGIGLALVRHLVELHHGRVEAHSEGIGKGCEFVVRLPLLPPGSVRLPEPAGEHAAGQGGRILLVDDDPDIGESTAMMMRLSGYEVETASDLDAALQAARRLRPQLVLVDLALPRTDGYEVARELRKLPEMDSGVSYVAVSGFGRPEDFERTEQAGFARLMVKPVDPAELDRLVRSLLEGQE